MKFLISLITILSCISCSNDQSMEDTILQNPNIMGVWKPYQYEYKGKIYPVNTCQQKGQILVNADFSGVYENYVSAASENCNLTDSFSGKWTYNAMYNILTLTYTEAGMTKTLNKNIETFSDSSFRIFDNTTNLDNIPGNDEAVLVFIKE